MAVKPGGKDITIKEQIIERHGLTLVFEALKPMECTPIVSRLTIVGDALPFGNLELLFSREGEHGGTGTALRGACTPSWLKVVPDSK